MLSSDSLVPSFRINVTRQRIALGRKGLFHLRSAGEFRGSKKVIRKVWERCAFSVCWMPIVPAMLVRRCIPPPTPMSSIRFLRRHRNRPPSGSSGTIGTVFATEATDDQSPGAGVRLSTRSGLTGPHILKLFLILKNLLVLCFAYIVQRSI